MIKTLNLAVLRLDGDTQARLALSQERVQEYAALMEDGEEFRPIDAFFDGSDYWLADGFHRYFATKANKKTSIAVTIHNGTLEDAQLFAFGANKHGLHMLATDIRQCIVSMLEHPVWGGWTNAAIAKHVGTSKMTVGRVKAAMSEPEESTEKKYINKHGQESTIDTAKLGRKAKPAEPPKPEPEVDHRVAELANTVNDLAEENQKLKDAIAIGAWDATDIEKEDAEETITILREEIRVLEIEVKTLRESRDMFQNRNAELMRTVKSLQAKLKKLGQ